MNTTFKPPHKPRISCIFAEYHATLKMYININNSPKRRVMQKNIMPFLARKAARSDCGCGDGHFGPGTPETDMIAKKGNSHEI